MVPALRRMDAGSLRLAFEESTRRIVGAEHLRLREGRATPPDARTDRTAVVLDVPSDAARPMLLEAVGPVHKCFDEWDVQVLATASQLAALVLEVERSRGVRLVTAPVVRDGAAPLLGSTPVTRVLRQTVERVAAIDFTALIQEGIGPQAHHVLGFPV